MNFFKKEIAQTDSNPIKDVSKVDSGKEFRYNNEVFYLLDEIEKKAKELLKQEGNITYGFRTFYQWEGTTTQQIHDVEDHLNVLSVSSSNTGKLVEDAFTGTKNSLKEIEKSKSDMENLYSHMNLVSDAFKEISNSFEQLKLQYDSISQFANVITDVANQTNLLSLNASIEAARVGEEGKGFAVVANEIKKLSTSTEERVKDILQALGSMTDIIDVVSNKSNEGNGVVVSTNKLIETSSDQLKKVEEAQNIVNQYMQQIKKAQVENQSEIQEIYSSLTSITEKSKRENEYLDELIFSVQVKAEYYLYILNHLNQIKILKESENF